MRKIAVSMFALAALAFAGTASAQMGMMGNYWQYGAGETQAPQSAQNSEIGAALQDIYSAQNITNQGQIDCSKVTDQQFATLGDAYMGLMLPNESQHQAMDNMMGGEGSQSLAQAHINMGRSYLGCWSNYNSGPVYMPMMGGYGYSGYGSSYGPGMMGYGSGWGPSMMSGWTGALASGGVAFSVFEAVLALVGLAAVIKWAVTKAKK